MKREIRVKHFRGCGGFLRLAVGAGVRLESLGRTRYQPVCAACALCVAVGSEYAESRSDLSDEDVRSSARVRSCAVRVIYG